MGSAGLSGLHKRAPARTDPQDPGGKRNAAIAGAKQFTIAGSLDFLEKTTKHQDKVATTPTTTENGANKPSASCGSSHNRTAARNPRSGHV